MGPERLLWRGAYFSLWLRPWRSDGLYSVRIGGADLFLLDEVAPSDVFALHGLVFEAFRRAFSADLLVSAVDRRARCELSSGALAREMFEIPYDWDGETTTSRAADPVTGTATVCFSDPLADIATVVARLLEARHFVSYPRLATKSAPGSLRSAPATQEPWPSGLSANASLLSAYRSLLIYGPGHELRVESTSTVLPEICDVLAALERSVLDLPEVQSRLATVDVTNAGSYVQRGSRVPSGEHVIAPLSLLPNTCLPDGGPFGG